MAKKKAAMDETEIKALVTAARSSALGGEESSELTGEREKALKYYNGEMADMVPPPGRSRAVSNDVLEVVEGMMPTLMDIFVSSNEVVRFKPQGPEDSDAAEQETDYVNHVFMAKNDGFLVLYSFIKDALLSKLGVVKVWHEETERVERQTYTRQPDEVLFGFLADEKYEIDDHTMEEDDEAEEAPSEDIMAPPPPQIPGGLPGLGGPPMMGAPGEGAPLAPPAPIPPMGPAALPPDPMAALMGGAAPPAMAAPAEPAQKRMLHSFTLVCRHTKRCARVEAVPPEEFLIDRNARNVRDASYCAHVTHKTKAQAVAMGYDEDQIRDLTAWTGSTESQSRARSTVEEQDGANVDSNWAGELVELVEHYVVCDYEKSGEPSLYKIVTDEAGELLMLKDGKPAIQPMDEMPFAALTPIIVTHRVIGKSAADLVIDIQQIKTALTRAMLDNIYLANNNRYEVAESTSTKHTIEDLLSNRIGGFIRVKTPGTINPVQNNPIGAFAYPMLEYVDGMRETRTGVSKMGQGLDPDVLQNQTAKAAGLAFNAAQAKTKLIARIFAETGIKDMFRLLHATIRKNGDGKAETVQLRNKWVEVNPKTWKMRDDMTANVGLGTGSRQEEMAALMVVMQVQEKALMQPSLNLVKPQHLYNTAKKLVALADMQSVDLYFNDPSGEPPPPPPEDPELAKIKMKHELDQQAAAAAEQREIAKAQRQTEIEAMQAKADAMVKDAELRGQLALKEREMMMAQQMAIFEAKIAERMQMMEMQFEQSRENSRLAIDHARAAEELRQNAAGQRFDQIVASDERNAAREKTDELKGVAAILEKVVAQNDMLMKTVTAETEILRDPAGKVKGTRKRLPKTED
jgi:hypothetical protein